MTVDGALATLWTVGGGRRVGHNCGQLMVDGALATLWTVDGGMAVTGSKQWIAGRLRTACAGQYSGGMADGGNGKQAENYGRRDCGKQVIMRAGQLEIGHLKMLLSAAGQFFCCGESLTNRSGLI
ncbi:hypothetical protein SAMN05428962_5784 [Paenibacillus sp. BC26]|nr:hypothetical protein SAMN05428962_5784 [Paenibacillus sp. BC26]